MFHVQKKLEHSLMRGMIRTTKLLQHGAKKSRWEVQVRAGGTCVSGPPETQRRDTGRWTDWTPGNLRLQTRNMFDRCVFVSIKNTRSRFFWIRTGSVLVWRETVSSFKNKTHNKRSAAFSFKALNPTWTWNVKLHPEPSEPGPVLCSSCVLVLTFCLSHHRHAGLVLLSLHQNLLGGAVPHHTGQVGSDGPDQAVRLLHTP